MATSINITKIIKGSAAQAVKVTGGDVYALLHHPLLDASHLSIWVALKANGYGTEVSITKQSARIAFRYEEGDNASEVIINSLYPVGNGKFGLRING